MTAPNYSAGRKELALTMGLGTKGAREKAGFVEKEVVDQAA